MRRHANVRAMGYAAPKPITFPDAESAELLIICHHRLDALRQHGAVFAEERTLSAAEAEALGHQDTRRVANYMFGSAARHPFLRHVLREIVIRSKRPITCENDVLESTGRGCLRPSIIG